MKKLIFISLTSVVLSLSVHAAPKPKVTICHFDEELDAFVKLSLPQKAADKHLAKHDDGLPDGITAITETPLDADCIEAGDSVDPAL